MNGKMRSHLTTAAIVILLLPAFAVGQVHRALTTVTNSVQVAATNATGSDTIDTMRQMNVTLLLSAKSPSTTNATEFVTGFKYSLDATNFYTLASLRVPLTLDGTNTANAATNLDCSWYRYLKVGSFENVAEAGASNAVTNIVIEYFFK